MIGFLFTLIVLGAVLFLVERHVPMAEPFRVVIRVVVVIILIAYLLRVIGLVPFPVSLR